MHKEIRADYFKAFEMVETEGVVDSVQLNLHDVLEALSTKNVEDRICENKYGDSIVPVTIIKRNIFKRVTTTDGKNIRKIYHFWEIQFIRSREGTLPVIFTSNGNYREVPLNDDELIGECVSVLYDHNNFVFFIQRNRSGITPAGIAEYFECILSNRNISLKAIVSQNDLAAFTDDKIYKSVEIISYDNSARESASVNEVLDLKDESEANMIAIKLSRGNRGKKDKGLNFPFVTKLINLFATSEETHKFVIRAKESADTETEVYDLIAERIHNFIGFEYANDNPITHSRIFAEMKQVYFRRLDEINQYINTGDDND